MGTRRTWAGNARRASIRGLLLLAAACAPEGHQEALPDLEHEAAASSHGAPAAGHEEESDAPHGEEEAVEHAAGSASGVVVAVRAEVDHAEAVAVVGPGGESFRVARRTPEIGHYPCISCHVRPIGSKDQVLAQMHAQGPFHDEAARVECNACHDPSNPGGLRLDCDDCHEREGLRDLMPSRTAHLTIELGHPTGRYRNCLTCHAPEDPGLLALQDGSRASMDEAYLLCAGCHFMQGSDWAGGAHGKRLAGWQGERVILSCTGCHNPHDPKFPVRKPVTFPKLARREAGR